MLLLRRYLANVPTLRFAVTCIALVLLLISAQFFQPWKYVQGFNSSSGGVPEASVVHRIILSSEDRDTFSVIPDHVAVSDFTQYCMKISPGAKIPWPVRREFLTPSQQLDPRMVSGSPDAWPPEIRQLTKSEKALVHLSSNISEHRLALLAQVRSTYFFWQLATMVSIAVGMITTVLVGVSSAHLGQGDGRTASIIRVLAIVFPAAGTAVTAVISFYSPQAEWGLASRSLAGMTQLHDQIAIGVWKLKCTADDPDGSEPLALPLEGWLKRYTDILALSGSASAPLGSQSRNGTGSDGADKQ
jgi:hypothetical protein